MYLEGHGCSDSVGSVGIFVVYEPLLKIGFLALECWKFYFKKMYLHLKQIRKKEVIISMLYVCVGDVIYAFSVCIVRHGAACASAWQV